MTTIQEKTFTKKDLEKEWNDGVEYGFEQGRLDVFEDLLKIKYVTWSVHHVNNKEWTLGNKNLDYPLDTNIDKSLKIVYNYHWYDENYKQYNEDLYGHAKNNTIGEVWKGIDRLYVKHGLVGTDHKFIEDINIEGNILKFDTGS